jgi:hypothetical protein
MHIFPHIYFGENGLLPGSICFGGKDGLVRFHGIQSGR